MGYIDKLEYLEKIIDIPSASAGSSSWKVNEQKLSKK